MSRHRIALSCVLGVLAGALSPASAEAATYLACDGASAKIGAQYELVTWHGQPPQVSKRKLEAELLVGNALGLSTKEMQTKIPEFYSWSVAEVISAWNLGVRGGVFEGQFTPWLEARCKERWED